MTTINGTQGKGNQNFKQIEAESWVSLYLPAIGAATVMAVVLFLAISCSKTSDKPAAKITAPMPETTSSASAPVAAVVPDTPKKKMKKQRPVNATYINGIYGVSFSYPRKYSLQPGDSKSSMPVQANFVKPGAVQIAAVDVPGDLYPETDFASAVLNVSVNPGMSQEDCAQFVPNSKDPEAAKPVTAKLGTNQFTELEQMNGQPEHQADLKYFHLFKNGACYEFALDVETSRTSDEELAQVDRGKVFQQLEKILTTARIKKIDLSAVETAQKPATEVPADAPKTEKAEVVSPEHQK